MAFTFKDDRLYCEDLLVHDVQERVPDSPFYLYSLARLRRNYLVWVGAFAGMPAEVYFAIKANSNLALLKHLREMGSGAALVSGNELRLALEAGFDPAHMVLNGNGKTVREIALAVDHGVMINVDSEFDLDHIERAAATVGREVNILIRINPDIDPDVHPYVSTGVQTSKFGIRRDALDWYLERIDATEWLHLVGVHCHLGSTIIDVDVFCEAVSYLADVVEHVRSSGHPLEYFNIGGGLGIDYERPGQAPKPDKLASAIRDLIPDDMTLIVEPGRSIIGDAGALIGRVIGVKKGVRKRFIVVDTSMAELLRPSLYNAYHEIVFTEPQTGAIDTFDVVGPVCESADFIGKDRRLQTPAEGAGIVVRDAGAYGYAMSSNYNMRTRPAEYIVDGSRLTRIRKAETFHDQLRGFDSADIE
jgi:diaminopimelate decarboxylase